MTRPTIDSHILVPPGGIISFHRSRIYNRKLLIYCWNIQNLKDSIILIGKRQLNIFMYKNMEKMYVRMPDEHNLLTTQPLLVIVGSLFQLSSRRVPYLN